MPVKENRLVEEEGHLLLGIFKCLLARLYHVAIVTLTVHSAGGEQDQLTARNTVSVHAAALLDTREKIAVVGRYLIRVKLDVVQDVLSVEVKGGF